MSDKLVFIKNAGSSDDHCGQLNNYFPIKIYGDCNYLDLEIDNELMTECPSWVKPNELHIDLDNHTKYLIYDRLHNYGYIYDGQINYFDDDTSKYVLQILKNLVFDTCIYINRK